MGVCLCVCTHTHVCWIFILARGLSLVALSRSCSCVWGLSLTTALHICSAGAPHPPCVIRPPPALLGLDTLPSPSRHWRECHPCLAPPPACSPHWCSPPFPLQSQLRRSLCPSVLFPAHCQETEHVSVVGVRDPPTPLDPHLDEGHRELSVRMTEV